MKRHTILIGGIFCLLGLIGVTTADLFQPPTDGGPGEGVSGAAEDEALDAPQVGEETEPQPTPEMAKPAASSRRARALRMDEDGFVVGYVSYVDPYSLNLEPVPEAVVTFMQNMTIITQAKTGPDGRFAVKGLTEHATYSVFVSSMQWVAMFGTFVEKYREDAVQGSPFHRNQLRFMGGSDAGMLEHAEGDPEFQAIQCVPWEDFFSAFNLGIFGDLCAQDVPVVPMPGPRGESGAGYIEAAYAAAAAAAITDAIAAATDELASPFGPAGTN